MGKETDILQISPTELREYTYEDGEYTLLLYESQKKNIDCQRSIGFICFGVAVDLCFSRNGIARRVFGYSVFL